MQRTRSTIWAVWAAVLGLGAHIVHGFRKGFQPDTMPTGPELCWATHDLASDEWEPATVVARGAAGVEVLFDSSGSRAMLPPAQVLPQNGPEQDHTPDLAQLVHLSEPCLLHTLGCRYSEGAIYTYTGTILIALNPWRELSLYSEEQLVRYCDQPLGSMPPHLFAIADSAFRGMRQACRCPRRPAPRPARPLARCLRMHPNALLSLAEIDAVRSSSLSRRARW